MRQNVRKLVKMTNNETQCFFLLTRMLLFLAYTVTSVLVIWGSYPPMSSRLNQIHSFLWPTSSLFYNTSSHPMTRNPVGDSKSLS